MKAVAEKADGRAVLRATEVLAKAETDMRFVSSPRVCLETAVMRIALPEEDMSTDALLVRLNALRLSKRQSLQPPLRQEDMRTSPPSPTKSPSSKRRTFQTSPHPKKPQRPSKLPSPRLPLRQERPFKRQSPRLPLRQERPFKRRSP